MSDSFIFRLMLIVVAIVIAFALVAQYNKNRTSEKFTSFPTTRPPAVTPSQPKKVPPKSINKEPFAEFVAPPPAPSFKKAESSQISAFENVDTQKYLAVDYNPDANKKPQPDPFPKGRPTTDDLLPKDAANSLWSQVNPAGQGDLQNVNLIDAGFNFGIDTQGQTLKNPNLQLRSEHPNPRMNVGPWMQSTIENDCSRRYFEIGEP
jgi:hypothetical protein